MKIVSEELVFPDGSAKIKTKELQVNEVNL